MHPVRAEICKQVAAAAATPSAESPLEDSQGPWVARRRTAQEPTARAAPARSTGSSTGKRTRSEPEGGGPQGETAGTRGPVRRRHWETASIGSRATARVPALQVPSGRRSGTANPPTQRRSSIAGAETRAISNARKAAKSRPAACLCRGEIKHPTPDRREEVPLRAVRIPRGISASPPRPLGSLPLGFSTSGSVRVLVSTTRRRPRRSAGTMLVQAESAGGCAIFALGSTTPNEGQRIQHVKYYGAGMR